MERVTCPDCHTVLSLSPEEDSAILKALSLPEATHRHRRADLHSGDQVWHILLSKTAGSVEWTAAEQVRLAMLRRRSFSPTTIVEPVDGAQTIALGVLGEHPAIDALYDGGRLRLELPGLDADGFLLQHIQDGPVSTIVVVGQNSRGLLYGSLFLAECIERGENLTGVCLRDQPTSRLRGGYMEGASESMLPEITTSGYHPTSEELLALARRRVNLLLLRENWCDNRHIRWSRLGERLQVPDFVEQAIQCLRNDIELSKRYGFTLLFHTSVAHPSWADEQLFAKYPDLRAYTDVSRHTPAYTKLRRYNPSHPLFRRMLQAEVEEVLELYPEIEGLYSWHGYDGAPLGCDRPENLDYAYSDRLIDAHILRYEALKRMNPRAFYIVDHSGLDFYRSLLEESLPSDVIFTTWSHLPVQDLLPFEKLTDPGTSAGTKWLPQFSSHAEGGVCGFMPVFDLEHLREEMVQFRQSRASGVFNHQPFIAASFGDPDRFIDISEPYHEAVLSWAWSMERTSAADELAQWARGRFPSVWRDVASAYESLAKIKRAFLPRQALLDSFIHGWTQPFDWIVLDPQAAWEATQLASFDAPRHRLQTPYGYPPRGEPVYIWDTNLRATPIARATLGTWLERFDARDEVEVAVTHMERAVARSPGDRQLARLKLQFDSVRCGVYSYFHWARAGLSWKACDIETDQVKDDLKDCLAWCYAQLVAPTNMSINWIRWGTRMFREEQCQTIRVKMAELVGLEWAPGNDLPRELLGHWSATVFPLGWQPDEADGAGAPLDLRGTATWDIATPLRDVEPSFYQDPHAAVPDSLSFASIPQGTVVFAGKKFNLGNRILAIGPGQLAMASHAAIPLGRPLHELAMLACAVGRELPDREVVAILFRYADGGTEEVFLRYRAEVTHYAFPEVTPKASVAWIQHARDPGLYHQYRVIGFNLCQIPNPQRDRPVSDIELRACSERCGILVFGLSSSD